MVSICGEDDREKKLFGGLSGPPEDTGHEDDGDSYGIHFSGSRSSMSRCGRLEGVLLVRKSHPSHSVSCPTPISQSRPHPSEMWYLLHISICERLFSKREEFTGLN